MALGLLARPAPGRLADLVPAVAADLALTQRLQWQLRGRMQSQEAPPPSRVNGMPSVPFFPLVLPVAVVPYCRIGTYIFVRQQKHEIDVGATIGVGTLFILQTKPSVDRAFRSTISCSL